MDVLGASSGSIIDAALLGVVDVLGASRGSIDAALLGLDSIPVATSDDACWE